VIQFGRLLQAQAEFFLRDILDNCELRTVWLPCESVGTVLFFMCHEVFVWVPRPVVCVGIIANRVGFEDGQFQQIVGLDENDGAKMFVMGANGAYTGVPNRKDFSTKFRGITGVYVFPVK